MTHPFRKMHGLGNDFVVLDARQKPLRLTPSEVRAIADRRFGVGCDQLITIEPSARGDVFIRINNPDGSEAEACGNATRCVVRMLLDETAKMEVVVETVAGLLHGREVDGRLIMVDMGEPRLDWQDIPLARAMDTLHLDYTMGLLRDPVAVNMGNPHIVFFVDDAEAIPLGELGPKIEHDPLFPARTNISVVSKLSANKYRLRVWERGAGLTMACGSAACATAVALKRRGMAKGLVELVLNGGSLLLEWRNDGHVTMTGPTAISFAGNFDPSLLVAHP